MSTSRFGNVVDALVGLIGTTDTVTFDGPPLTSDIPADYVVVGGTEDPDDEAGEFDQDWAGIGRQSKNETGSVTFAVLAGTGDDDVKVARDRALDVFGQIEDLVRADPSLGGVIAAGWCHVASGRPRQVRTSNGTYVRIAGTVDYQSRI